MGTKTWPAGDNASKGYGTSLLVERSASCSNKVINIMDSETCRDVYSKNARKGLLPDAFGGLVILYLVTCVTHLEPRRHSLHLRLSSSFKVG